MRAARLGLALLLIAGTSVAQAAAPAAGPVRSASDSAAIARSDSMARSEAARDSLRGKPLLVARMDPTFHEPLIPLTINGEGPFQFRVDTSWPHSVISSELAGRLRLRRDGEVRLRLPAGGVEDHEAYVAPNVGAGKLRAPELRIAGMDPAGIQAWSRSDYDGVLGYDFVRQFVFEVDYRVNGIALYDPSVYVPPDSGYALQAGADVPAVQVIYDEKHPAWLVVGTGLRKVLFLRHRFVESNRLWRGGDPGEETQFWTPAGARRARVFRHRRLHFGDRVLEVGTVLGSMFEEEQGGDAPGFDGELSALAFQNAGLRITFDGPRGRLYIEQPFGGKSMLDMVDDDSPH